MVEKKDEPTLKNQTGIELKGDREIVISRTFNGPARIVFEAWTKPELVSRWWLPKSCADATMHCEADVRVGGKYRYVTRLATGEEFAFSGEYTEIVVHSRLVYTCIYELAASAGAAIVTVTFEERGAKTHLVSHELYPSKEARQAALDSGMEHGLRETMDQLDQLVTSLL
jgi:uncharacterized protein YndB with AHSA1/START domain